MMLRDGVLIMLHMAANSAFWVSVSQNLGSARISFMCRDFLMLENQIPYSVIKFIIQLFKKDEGEALICSYLSNSLFGDERLTRVPWDAEEEPLLLLEADRMILLKEDEDKCSQPHCFPICKWPRSEDSEHTFQRITNPFRSVTELVAKGIHFWPSSNCLRDITFASYACSGLLRLPIWCVTTNSKVFFANQVAIELSPDSNTSLDITSYLTFMKSLIESPKDVKKLREKGILFSTLGSDDEVVELFKDIDTMGLCHSETIEDVKQRIDKHCNSRGKTWMADLIHTYFRTPWTAIALLAAAFILFLTFSQTYLAFLSYRRDDHKN